MGLRLAFLLCLVAAQALAQNDSRDERLATEVRDALAASGFDGKEVQVRVSRGVVYLTGTVYDAREKLRVIAAVFRVSEVEALEAEVGVLHGITPGLEEAVWQALFDEGIESAISEVLVEAGVATVRGAMKDEEARKRAVRVVASVPGIDSVRNEISLDLEVTTVESLPAPPPAAVKPPEPVETEPVETEPTTGERERVESWSSNAPTISHQIAYAILAYPGYTVFDSVQFSLEGEEVALLGAVTAVSKKRELEERIRAIPGVGVVKNDLRVLSSSKDDERLREKLFQRIYQDPLFAAYAKDPHPPIHILVDSGIVTLTGVVDDPIERMSAEGIARNVFEVTFVRNQIRVRRR